MFDYLTLHTGGKFPVPFDCLLIFATNLDPAELVEEAFLRRIHYKIPVVDPTRDQYDEIFRRCCQAAGVAYTAESVTYVFDEFYDKRGIRPRGCHPRDLLAHVTDIAKYREMTAGADRRPGGPGLPLILPGERTRMTEVKPDAAPDPSCAKCGSWSAA